jgi:undecaprenyl-phosphate 4-deoxy-4-formamido-L-arabinose transferase
MTAIQTPVSIVVPVYNSESSLPLLYERLNAVMTGQRRGFELILVDDGSRDESWAVICRLAAQHTNVRGFHMLRNYGQHNALLCGIRAAGHRFIATMDDDLQNPPEELPRLLEELEKGYDVVYGTPQKQTHGLFRDAASTLTKVILQRAMGAGVARNLSAFRVFRTELRSAFADYRGSYVSIDVLLTWGARRYSAIPVRNDPRVFGESNYTFYKLVSHAINITTGFSTLPLKLASVAGFACTVFGLAILAWVTVGYLLHGSSVPGFAFLASMTAIFSGAQLFTLGIFGEYLARIHVRSMDKPSYTIGESTESGEGAA